MVFDVLGTASLMSGVPMASERPPAFARPPEPALPAEDPTLVGHPVHAARTHSRDVVQGASGRARPAGGGGGGVGPLGVAMGGLAYSGYYNKGLYQEDRYIDRARREDFFFSLMHASPHAAGMMHDIMTILHLDYAAMPAGRCGVDTFGHFVFHELDFPVNIAAILDSIMLLKECTERYQHEVRGPGGHGVGWTFENHHGRCQIAAENLAAAAALAAGGAAPLAPAPVADCLCCNAIFKRANTRWCPICKPPSKRPCVLGVGRSNKPPAYIDDNVYPRPDASRSARVSCIFNISGHLASLLAMHAYYNTDLLRPGNFAPLYNVALTASYFSTLSRGLLLRKFTLPSRRLLTRLLEMMVYHELWIAVNDDYLAQSPSSALLSLQDHADATDVLFDKDVVLWNRVPCGAAPARGRALVNPELLALLKSLPMLPVSTLIRELHDCNEWWVCEHDYIEDGLHRWVAAPVDESDAPGIIYVRKTCALTVEHVVTQWMLFLSEDEIPEADETPFDIEDEMVMQYATAVNVDIRSAMRAAADVLIEEQMTVLPALTQDAASAYLMRDGYVVTVGVDAPSNTVRIQSPDHMGIPGVGQHGFFTVYIGTTNVKVFAVQHPLQPATPQANLLCEEARISQISKSSTLCTFAVDAAGAQVTTVYRPFRWYEHHA